MTPFSKAHPSPFVESFNNLAHPWARLPRTSTPHSCCLLRPILPKKICFTVILTIGAHNLPSFTTFLPTGIYGLYYSHALSMPLLPASRLKDPRRPSCCSDSLGRIPQLLSPSLLREAPSRSAFWPPPLRPFISELPQSPNFLGPTLFPCKAYFFSCSILVARCSHQNDAQIPLDFSQLTSFTFFRCSLSQP